MEGESALPLEPLLLAAAAALQRTTPAADRPRNNEPAATSVTKPARLLRIGVSAARNPWNDTIAAPHWEEAPNIVGVETPHPRILTHTCCIIAITGCSDLLMRNNHGRDAVRLMRNVQSKPGNNQSGLILQSKGRPQLDMEFKYTPLATINQSKDFLTSQQELQMKSR